MREPVRYGLIGCGVVGESMAPGVEEAAGSELCACVDLDREKAEELASEFDVDNVYTEYTALFDGAQPDVAIVATPSGTHGDIAVECANAGLHVLCQKPLDVAVERMDAMISASETNDVKLGGLFNTRFKAGPQRAKQLLDSGALGDIVLANGILPAFRDQDYYDSAEWRGTLDMDGGCLMNQGIHTVDRLAWFNDGIERVFADVDTIAHDMEAEDIAAVQVRFGNGAKGTITATTATRHYPAYDRIDIYGEYGYLSVTPAELLEFETEDAVEEEIDRPQLSGFGVQIEDMTESINEDREPLISGTEARHAPDAVLAMYESSSRDEPVTVQEFLEKKRVD